MGIVVGILCTAVVYGLTIGWIIRGWGQDSVKADIDAAAWKWFCAPFLSMVLGGLLLRQVPDAASVLYWTIYPAVVVLGVLVVASISAGITARVKDRAHMRLSGHPVPPKLWPAWRVAAVAGAVMFILVMAADFAFVVLTTHISSLQGPDPTRYQALNANFMTGSVFAWISITTVSWVVQKICIFTAERDYAQLSTGIETRLAKQREELLATRGKEPARAGE